MKEKYALDSISPQDQAAVAAIVKNPKKNRSRSTIFLFLLAPVFSLLVYSMRDAGLAHPFTMIMLSLFPLHLAWTAILFSIGRSMAIQFKGRLPMDESSLLVFSLTAYACSPIFTSGHFTIYSYKWLDPSFIIWSLTQITITYCYVHYLEEMSSRANNKQEEIANNSVANNSFAFNSLLFAICANFYIPLSFFAPIFIENSQVLGVSWFASQALTFLYYKWKIRDHRISLEQELSSASRRAVISGFSGDDLVISYKPNAGIERWIQQRLRSGGLRKGSKIAMLWFVGPFTVIGIVYFMYAFFFGSTGIAPQLKNDQVSQIASGNMNFIIMFCSTLLISITVLLAKNLLAPTHLCLSRQGLQLMRKNLLGEKKDRLLLWNTIKSIYLKGDKIVLEQKTNRNTKEMKLIELRLSAVESVEDRENMLKAFQAWAPTANKSPELNSALKAPVDHSYTELWLEALTAPPKRDKLKPLAGGESMKSGAYNVIELLGAGGQGHAYLVSEKISTELFVAKEFILPVFVDISIRKQALEQFENEARILSQLDNPRIVKLHDYFIEDHRAYLILEYIKGRSLKVIVEEEGALSENSAKDLLAQMCTILEYLHGMSPPVVHRDFTPDNLILEESGVLKLIDFNVAQRVESKTTGTIVGKQAYLPPEQFRGQPTSQSDIYALGASLHYLLTGEEPVPISISRPKSLRTELSDEIEAIVEKATQLDTAKRFESVEEIRKLLVN